jgi:hypothetical protein
MLTIEEWRSIVYHGRLCFDSTKKPPPGGKPPPTNKGAQAGQNNTSKPPPSNNPPPNNKGTQAGQNSTNAPKPLGHTSGLVRPSSLKPLVDITEPGSNRYDFYKFNGSDELWKLPASIQQQVKYFRPAPVKLNVGIHNGPHSGFGCKHIEAEHGKEIAKLGLSVPEYVYLIVSDPTKVWYAGGDRLQVINEKFTGSHKAIIELQNSHNYYSVVTAFSKPPEGNVIWRK